MWVADHDPMTDNDPHTLDPTTRVLMYYDFINTEALLQNAIQHVTEGYLVVCYADRGRDKFEYLKNNRLYQQMAMESGCHWVMTDWPAPPSFPGNASASYWLTFYPEGRPVRCNPITGMGNMSDPNNTLTVECLPNHLNPEDLPSSYVEDGIKCTNEEFPVVAKHLLYLHQYLEDYV
jgi:hypothetical protein